MRRDISWMEGKGLYIRFLDNTYEIEVLLADYDIGLTTEHVKVHLPALCLSGPLGIRAKAGRRPTSQELLIYKNTLDAVEKAIRNKEILDITGAKGLTINAKPDLNWSFCPFNQ